MSAVIASNRVDTYLDEAIASLFANKNISLEIVLVLDGIELPKPRPSWADDARLKIVYRSESGGPGVAANDGIQVASHEIIARLDSDDIAHNNRLELQVNQLLSELRPVLVGSKTTLIDPDGGVIGQPSQPSGPDIRRQLLLQNVVPHSTFVFRKSDAQRVGLYNPNLRQMEDYDFLLRMAQIGPVSMLEQSLCDYRVHPGQTSKKAGWRANYITAVLAGRRALGKVLGVSRLEVESKILVWRLVQIVRSAGLVKPRYLIGVQKPAES